MSGLWLATVGANTVADFGADRALRYAESDARHTYAALSSQTAHVMRGKHILDRHVYAHDMSTMLGEMLSSATDDDEVIIYFAGHGLVEQTDTGPQLFLGVHGTRLNEIEATAPRVNDMLQEIERCRARSCAVILDCCFSGNASGRSLFGPRYLADLARGRRLRRSSPAFSGEGRLLLGAAGKDKVAHESTSLRSGVFTYYLLKVLNAHSNNTPTISFARLHADLLDSMNRATEGRQLPYVSGDDNAASFPTTAWRNENSE